MMQRYESGDILDGLNAAYDQAAKRVLSAKVLLAEILEQAVPEFYGIPVQEIAEHCIEGEPQESELPVHRDQKKSSPAEIIGDTNEDSSWTEGKIYFDILFHARAPKSHESIALIINLEIQKDSPSEYPLLRRAVYYGARLISSQKEKEFRGMDYGNAKKAYTVWICLEAPAGKSAINLYAFHEEQKYGNYSATRADYDLINLVLIHVGKEKPANRMLSVLWTIFNAETTDKEKRESLKREHDILLPQVTQEELNEMCNLSQGVLERGISIGIAEGKAEGRAEGRIEGKAEGRAEGKIEGKILAWTNAVQNIRNNLNLSVQEAMDILQVPADLREKVALEV